MKEIWKNFFNILKNYVTTLDNRLRQYDDLFKMLIKTSKLQIDRICYLEKRILDLEKMLELQCLSDEDIEDIIKHNPKNKKFLN